MDRLDVRAVVDAAAWRTGGIQGHMSAALSVLVREGVRGRAAALSPCGVMDEVSEEERERETHTSRVLVEVASGDRWKVMDSGCAGSQ